MTWRDSDHARLVALKMQRAQMRRGPDEEKDKNKMSKLTTEIKALRKRLINYEKIKMNQANALENPIEEPVEDSVEEISTIPEPVRLSWPQFRTKHKGKATAEISKLWAEYKESAN